MYTSPVFNFTGTQCGSFYHQLSKLKSITGPTLKVSVASGSETKDLFTTSQNRGKEWTLTRAQFTPKDERIEYTAQVILLCYCLEERKS